MATKMVASATVRAVKKRMLPSRAALVLTQAAVDKIKELMAKEEAKGFIGLKVGVRQRGCNGLSYILDYAKAKEKLDEEVKQDGVTIIIDKKAQLTLLGKFMWDSDCFNTALASVTISFPFLFTIRWIETICIKYIDHYVVQDLLK